MGQCGTGDRTCRSKGNRIDLQNDEATRNRIDDDGAYIESVFDVLDFVKKGNVVVFE